MTVTRPNLALTSSFVQGQDGWASAMNDNIDNIDEVSGVSVDAYGAAGDGVTDDAASFMAAHNALPANGGKIATSHGKVYAIGSTLAFTKRVVITGGGKAVDHNSPNFGYGGTTLLRKSTLSGNMITLTGAGSIIENLAITREGSVAAGSSGDGIQILGHSIMLKHVSVMLMKGNGIRIGTTDSTNCNVWRLEHVTCRGNSLSGCYIHSDDTLTLANANAGLATGCSFNANGEKGLRIKMGWFNTFIGTHTEGNTGEGIYLETKAISNVFFGGDQEANGITQVRVADTGCIDNVFHYVLIDNNDYVDAGTRTVINNDTVLTVPDREDAIIRNTTGPSWATGKKAHFSLYATSTERVRFGWRYDGAQTGLACAQFIAMDPGDAVVAAKSDTNGGKVWLRTGTGLSGYLLLDNNASKVETNENLRLTGGYVEINERSAPGAGSANSCRIYAKDVGGKTGVFAQFFGGGEIQFAQSGGTAMQEP